MLEDGEPGRERKLVGGQERRQDAESRTARSESDVAKGRARCGRPTRDDHEGACGCGRLLFSGSIPVPGIIEKEKAIT